MKRCDGCGHVGEDVKSSLMFDLCPRCEAGLRAAHATYAEARRDWWRQQLEPHVSFLKDVCK